MRNLFLFLLLLIILICTHTYAANDLDDWNGNVSKEVRQKLNNDTTTYKTLSSVKATAEQSSSKYTDTVTRAGSKVGVTIDALKVPASKTDIAKAYLARHKGAIKNLAKGGAYTFVGSAALGVLIKGIGWVMDEGGKLQVHNQIPYNHPSHEFYYNLDLGGQSGSYSTVSELCNFAINRWGSNTTCSVVGNSVNAYTNGSQFLIGYKIKNPYYNSSTTEPSPVQEVTDSQFQQAIQDQLTNAPNSDLSNQLATDAYTLQDSSGKATDSLAKADTTSGINDAAKTIVDAAKSAIANDANPQNAKLTSGSSGKAETETKNQDGTTGETSKSSTNFQLPAFCDWASYVCEFIDWVKEDPEQPESIELPTTELNERSFVENLFKVTASCPPDNTLTLPLPHGPVFTYTFTYTRFCSYLDLISYIFVAVSYFWAASIVVRS
ncbi:virulence factor TspB C-terminal domain-related protein (plasmid) [Acinetobacter soli]|nr:virulence factor TspB C-terminal domain-related protein [Acinetobacter soli]WEH87874.1 virulence factor TspB C-terminal domain-related protein [Acinetobacter soli]WEI11437.1 virulence factor TspB C-terminal domain-related protein [Acinetobacter soli]WEI11447.1 virulence factor TspB C-terminal domain-related protein [Acinetobacter soli]